MNESFNDLINEFNIISKKGWIPSVSNSFGSIGLTFKKEIGKKVDSLYFPDYKNIEIKCTSRFSRYPLFLFTVAFDDPTFPEIDRIVEKVGSSKATVNKNKGYLLNLLVHLISIFL